MKETIESMLVLTAIIVIAEVVNEIAGYQLVQVELDKNTIKGKSK